MVTMHGFFDLKDQTDEATFKSAYDAFGAYLVQCERITSYKAMRRTYDDNYDSSPPPTKYYVSMNFKNLDQSQDCWDFIEKHDETSGKLHRNVFSRIKDYSFFLSEDIPS